MTQAVSYNAAFVTAQGGVANAFDAPLAGLDAGTAYFNLHSAQFPTGEIRGFLQPAPEPDNLVLLLARLGFLGFAARRDKHG